MLEWKPYARDTGEWVAKSAPEVFRRSAVQNGFTRI
jgi:hypothetical protein